MHPYVVAQNNVLNASRLNTVVVCSVTSKLKYASYPGNVRLRRGGAGLRKDCVVNVTQVFTVNKSDLGEWIGRLSPRKVSEVVVGLWLILSPRDV